MNEAQLDDIERRLREVENLQAYNLKRLAARVDDFERLPLVRRFAPTGPKAGAHQAKLWELVEADTTAAAVLVLLPTARKENAGTMIGVSRTYGSNTLTIDCAESDIDGGGSQTHASVALKVYLSTGAQWISW